MSCKKAFKLLFKIYEDKGRIGANQVEKIAEKYHISFYKLEHAVLEKGLEFTAYCSW
ncbi:hypothetical protein MBBAR_10c00760 [Methanobrevibacter arboriphilus JCM 13429 = DSM 1125]|uniref:Transcriptional regulator n=1 Tax=Methanobrevibacter arboriphilus JCM 13429 = DSM 1125 TaxID=1300164 RepID=A0A1V6N246_METAZ|nr:hypothetical protein [Methanobrevibacter arboriphilus]OQD58735.1 hypothetical protein MBBAR_10c00760 [Methanobrevibacter arboriphilus JCM 13429 = DSM 1125]